ncbi:hypothetical protein FACS1894133_2560 [Clostridia bacterium]|nr:hypothetical protein FACS1894133_2560 [Clostridia bacterium]
MYKNKLKVYRKAKGLNQTELAVLIGQSQEYVSRIERGERSIQNVSGKILLAITKALGCGFEELMEETKS